MQFPLAPALLIAALLVGAAPAAAQDDDGWRVRAGAGVQYRPQHIGADDQEWAPLWNFSIKRGEDPFDFGAPDDSFGISLVSGGGFSAGPIAKYEGSRKESDVGAPVGKVPATIEVGGFVQHQISPAFRLRGEVRKGLGGHRGLVASLGGDKVWRDGDRYLVSLGPRLLLSDGRYQRAWFGVTPEVATATGLSAYRPDGGLHGVGAVGSLDYSLGGPWGLFGFARYDRLVGDAAKSPIVRQLGSRNQFAVGVGVNRTFSIRF